MREKILILLAQEPQTPSIKRQIEFLQDEMARLEPPYKPSNVGIVHFHIYFKAHIEKEEMVSRFKLKDVIA